MKIFKDTYCQNILWFPNVGMRTSVFREEAFVDYKVEKYQNKL